MNPTPKAGESSSSPRRFSDDDTSSISSGRRSFRERLGRPSSRVSVNPRGVVGAMAGLAIGVVFVGWALASGDDGAEGGLTVVAAILLGVIEGITEWLPISSTGHLTVASDLLGIDGAAAKSYAIAIQAGAILAVLSLYRERFVVMANGILGRDPAGRRTVVVVVVACIPAVVVGLLFEDVIKASLFGTWPIVVAWFVGGGVILAFARWRRGVAPSAGAPLTSLDWRGGLMIGIAQILALCPGVSRSLVTIIAATMLGLAVPAAVEFSFLLGFVILGGATFYETLSGGSDMLEAYGLATPLLGVAVAFVASAVAMRWMVAYLNRHGLAIFGYYRIGIAVVVGGMLLTGAL